MFDIILHLMAYVFWGAVIYFFFKGVVLYYHEKK